MKTMEFSELHMILTRLSEEFGMTKIVVSKEGFSLIGELVKQQPVDMIIDRSAGAPPYTAKIGNVRIEALSEYGKILWNHSPLPDSTVVPERFAENFQKMYLGEWASEDKRCQDCRHSRWLGLRPRKCQACTNYNCFEPRVLDCSGGQHAMQEDKRCANCGNGHKSVTQWPCRDCWPDTKHWTPKT